MAKETYLGIPTKMPQYNVVDITSKNIAEYFDITNNNAYYFELSGSTFTSNNKGVSSSSAITTLTAKQDVAFSFDYSVSSEAGYDKLTITVNGVTVVNGVSGKNSGTYEGSVTTGQTIVLRYYKDSSGSSNNDVAIVSNLKSKIYTGYVTENVARQVGAVYFGDKNDTSQMFRKGYIGVGGVARLFYEALPRAILHSDGSMVFQYRGSGGYEVSGNGYTNQWVLPWTNEVKNIKTATFKQGLPINSLSHFFYNARNMITVDYSKLDMSKVTNMWSTHYSCYNLTGSPICGENVTNMDSAYFYCSNITGSPACGNKVTSMHNAYYSCSNLTGSPVCGNNVTNMRNSYYDCYKLTGQPACGDSVSDMSDAYYNCRNLTGSPVCGSNVTNMEMTYWSCSNLTGSPVCGDKVTSMYHTYSYCTNLTGVPVFGNNVTTVRDAYCNCVNLSAGDIYMRSNNISNVRNCFKGKNNSRQYNIYAYQGTTTWNTLYKNDTSSIVGSAITWTNYSNAGFYNTAYNIYVLPL